jgi:hypothetical protein
MFEARLRLRGVQSFEPRQLEAIALYIMFDKVICGDLVPDAKYRYLLDRFDQLRSSGMRQ